MADHSIFSKFKKWEGIVPADFVADFTGAMISTRFVQGWDLPQRKVDRYCRPRLPQVNEDYFEYITLLRSIHEAHGSFTMVELGAGYGRWIVAAAKLSEQVDNLHFFLTGVEAEPEHFRMMQEHFINNGINPDNYLLVNAAITDREGLVDFATGYAHEWWGQSIVTDKGKRITGYDRAEARVVQAVTLRSLLKENSFVDLIDMDIQGEEYRVLSHSQDTIQDKVRRIHIGTHGPRIEQDLEQMFSDLKWVCEFNFKCNSEADAGFGRVSFQDGVQVWKNKRLG